MAQHVYPSFDICNLNTDKILKDLISIEPFGGYVSRNPHLQGIHTHSFYHLTYFRKGSGQHTIDFHTFPVSNDSFYIMKPGQVHNWEFSAEEAEGIVINFSPLFFDTLKLSSALLVQLPVLEDIHSGTISFSDADKAKAWSILEQMLREKQEGGKQSALYMATLLLQFLILAGRQVQSTDPANTAEHIHYAAFRQFEQLTDLHYRQKKLPKEYAEMMFVSTHQLNIISKTFSGVPAGTYIRNRLLLEAKRLLVNFGMHINEIAFELDFSDASNFGKFFKKYTGMTPEQFRNAYKPE